MGFINFLKMKKKWNEFPCKDIIMFSEGNTYKFSNIPILENISKHKTVYYITLDPNDDILFSPPKNVHSFLIKLDFFGLLFLQTLQGKLFITTTPGLDNLALKRSQHIKHYSYFMHSPIDVGGYQKHSFDNFDSIVCVGDFQIDSINQLEKNRNVKIKEKISLGLPYYDVFSKEYNESIIDSSQNNKDRKIKTILIAPSWGGKNFINIIKEDIFEILLKNKYTIIFRPHPQSFIDEKELLKKIEHYNSNENFTLDTETSIIPTFKKADILISSFSGIVFDFAYLTGNPSIVFDFKRDENLYDSIDLDRPSWDKTEIHKISIVLEASENFNILETIESFDIKKYKNNILESKKQIVNFGNCSEKIAQFFIDKIDTL